MLATSLRDGLGAITIAQQGCQQARQQARQQKRQFIA
jgi:hypothetical protein